MAKPRVFISSTYYDLKYIRSSLDEFVQSLGFETVLSEKGNIPYTHDLPLDKSCYREVLNADIFVLIIGGRYGSYASEEVKKPDQTFYDEYNSVTKKEYETAVEKDLPIYILIENSVYTEYRTYTKNTSNKTVEYAHVDSFNVYKLIGEILSQPRNNPVFAFNKSIEIEAWLREQWSGLFKEMLSNRSEQKQISSLSSQVRELSEISTTLKNYLEDVLKDISGETADEIIKNETKRLTDAIFSGHNRIQALSEVSKIPIEKSRSIFTEATTFDDLLKRLWDISKNEDKKSYDELVNTFKNSRTSVDSFNEVRIILGLEPLTFEDEQ